MSSTQRAYAQRNNNVTVLTPQFVAYNPDISGGTLGGSIAITGVPIYALNLPSVYVGGIYIVDLSGTDSVGDILETGSLDISGGPTVPLIYFSVNIPYSAACYPGQEFTIFFKNQPNAFFYSIGLISPTVSTPLPYCLSPPIPFALTSDFTQSATFKTDGVTTSVTGTGPAGWLGIFAYIGLLRTLTL